MIFAYLSITYFFIGFMFGILGVYMFGPEVKSIYVYPNEEKTKSLLYEDESGKCFQLSEKEVECKK
jgi:hypothetical protein